MESVKKGTLKETDNGRFIYLDQSVIDHPLNEGKKIMVGWNAIQHKSKSVEDESLNVVCCGRRCPEPPVGEVGFWFCLNCECVWI